MAFVYRYVNNNPYPVSVSNKRGGMTKFAQGKGTTDPWYAHFVGNKRLTRVPILQEDSSGIVKPYPVVPVNKRPLVSLSVPVEEFTPDYIRKAGIYTCVHCPNFKSASKDALDNHLMAVHGVGAAQKAIPNAFVPKDEEDQVVMSTNPNVPVKNLNDLLGFNKPAKVEPEPVKVEEPAKVEPEPVKVEEPAKVEPEIKKIPKLFKCNTCGKQFRSKKTLTNHIKKKHTSVKKDF